MFDGHNRASIIVIIVALVVILIIVIALSFACPCGRGAQSNFTLFDDTSPSSTRCTFVTFGDDVRFGVARDRLVREANSFGVFSTVIGYSQKDLDPEFLSKYGSFIANNSRGYGYWIWKPYLIKRTLAQMSEGDLLLYVDAGCRLNPQGRKRLEEYMSIANGRETNFGFRLKGLSERRWTKGDAAMAVFPDSSERERHMSTDQYLSGIFILKNCAKMRALVDDWCELSQNTHLIDDSPSARGECSSFEEHRHDQSLFSLLRKKYGCAVVDDETYFEGNWEEHVDKPIHARRSRT